MKSNSTKKIRALFKAVARIAIEFLVATASQIIAKAILDLLSR